MDRNGKWDRILSSVSTSLRENDETQCIHKKMCESYKTKKKYIVMLPERNESSFESSRDVERSHRLRYVRTYFSIRIHTHISSIKATFIPHICISTVAL